MRSELLLRMYIRITFGLTTLIISLGTVYTYYKSWSDYSDYVTQSLTRDASIATSGIEAKLTEAAKVLDVVKMRLEEAIAREAMTPALNYQVLHKTLTDLQRIDRLDTLGLLFFIDSQGRLYAQNDRFPALQIDFSDRYYFRAFQHMPMPSLVVSNLVRARTNGKFVFHLATPIHDANGSLLGVLVQQILADRIAEDLKRNLGISGAEILIRTHEGRLMFVYPFTRADKMLVKSDEGWTLAEAPPTTDTASTTHEEAQKRFVGYVQSLAFDFTGSASLHGKDVFETYFRRTLLLIVLPLLGGVIILGLFWHLMYVAKLLEKRSQESLFDQLTGLGNRRLIDEEFPRLWRGAMRTQQPICALFIDVDHFKKFNDDFGHEAGDEILHAVGRVLRKHARRPMDLCCRWGGEEFALIYPDVSEVDGLAIAQDILLEIQVMVVTHQGVLLPRVTVSIGLACAQVTPDNVTDDLIDMADKAMLHAKRNGRNQCQLFRGVSEIVDVDHAQAHV